MTNKDLRGFLKSIRKHIFSIVFSTLYITSSTFAQLNPPAPVGPIPSANQLRWQQMEYYSFVHFSLNTYTDQSWGFGNESLQLFNPKELDCRQWARICKQAGMKGIIVTAKHHSGFCLWPSKYTEYSVKNVPWKNGKGDIIRELADACKEFGLKLGIYLSPWDRNHPDYGKPEYISYFRNQLTELLTNYGPVFEIWFDGANGGTGYYGGANENRVIDRKTYYDWGNTYKLIRKLQPNIVIWNDGGDRGDLRWVGTEGGWVGETNWSLLNDTGDVPYEMLHHGVENGNAWVPAEVNTSIRPEWFYHPGENDRVKTVSQLMETYYRSIGRNGSLLLNFPIDVRGLIHENDEKAALGFAAEIKKAFAINLASGKKATASNVRGRSKEFSPAMTIDGNNNSYWATDDSVTIASLTIDPGKPTTINRFLVQEHIALGQRVKRFNIEALIAGQWKELISGTTIGYKRILQFPAVSATKFRLNITDAKGSPAISNIGLYNAPQILEAPTVIRAQNGEVKITPADKESTIYYTLDGTAPGPGSKKYTGPIPTDGKLQVKAIAYEKASRKSSPVTIAQFGVARKDWKIIDIADDKSKAMLDGDSFTTWHQQAKTLPAELVIDLGHDENLSGFRYLPDQDLWNPGIITQYEFYVSADNKNWKLVDQGEFANIKNNPLWQSKTFATEKARYIKIRALRTAENNGRIGYAEIDVIIR